MFFYLLIFVFETTFKCDSLFHNFFFNIYRRITDTLNCFTLFLGTFKNKIHSKNVDQKTCYF